MSLAHVLQRVGHLKWNDGYARQLFSVKSHPQTELNFGWMWQEMLAGTCQHGLEKGGGNDNYLPKKTKNN
jgi:hypothetical protein